MRITNTDSWSNSGFDLHKNRISGFFRSTTDTTNKPRLRVGLALGGGGAKGAIHIGVLKALADANIEVDLISGTSVGAYIGLLYCAGRCPEYICRTVEREFRISRFWDLLPGGAYLRLARMLRSGHVQKSIERHVDIRNIEQLPKQFVATATDLVAGETVYFRQGCVKTAVVASMNVPGLASPYMHKGRLLVDGGVLENLPAPAARRAGADIVIAVDISGDSRQHDNDSLNSPTASVNRTLTLQRKLQHESQLAEADILIQPCVKGIKMADFSRDPAELAVLGERATQQALPKFANAVCELSRTFS